MEFDPTPRFTRQDGYSLVEVLVAALVTTVGLIGTFSIIDGAQAETTKNRAREGAVALQREIVEAARSLPYDQLTPASVLPGVQAQPGLADSQNGDAGWTLRRRGLTYTATLGTCAVDDPRDGLGAHEAGVFCATGDVGTSADACRDVLSIGGNVPAGPLQGAASVVLGDCGVDVNLDGAVDGLTAPQGTVCAPSCGTPDVDKAPADYKRVVSLVRWSGAPGVRYSLQSTTVANPGQAGAPGVTALTQPAAVTSGTSVPFSVTTSQVADSSSWSVDGTPIAPATGGGTAFSFTWALGTVSAGSSPNGDEVLDGSYVVGAKAFDKYGQSGTPRSSTVVLNRRKPYPVTRLEAGRSGTDIVFEWAVAKERDVSGYRVYRQPTIGGPVLACATSGTTRCRDASPPASSGLVYYAVALDHDADGNVREGDPSQPVVVTDLNQAPSGPPTVTATLVSGGTQLTWAAGAADADPSDRIDHYVIYRDGSAYADRYDRTPTGDELTFLDTHANGELHDYWVAAVDTQLAESPKTGPVRR
jgi:hypothetical protein